MEKNFSKEDAYQTLMLINSWINNVDTKASVALAFQAIVIGLLFNKGLPSAFKALGNIIHKDEILMVGINVVLVAIFIIGCIISTLFFLLTLIAKTENKSGKKSVMFFGTIASYSLNDYKAKTMNMGDSEIIKDLLEQVHTNSEICSLKFKRYNIGIKIMIPVFIYGIAIILCGIV